MVEAFRKSFMLGNLYSEGKITVANKFSE